jgi:YfiH family protein
MTASMEDAQAIGAVDAILAQGGLTHGQRSTRRPAGAARTRTADMLESAPASATAKSRPGVVKVAAWTDLPWLRAGFSTRQGGSSVAYCAGVAATESDVPGQQIQGEQNLGWTTEDPALVVAENRRRFVRAVSASRPMPLVTIRQFHSGLIRVVEPTEAPLATPGGKAVLRGDALMTRHPGLLLGIQTADCVPVLIADTRTRAVAAFHAGWRGTLARVVERGVGAMRLEFGSRPQDLVAAIGPAIGACCFAVGEEVRFEFESQFGYADALFSEVYDSDPVRQKYPMLFLTARAPGHSNLGPQIHLDLRYANRRQLLDAGLRPAAIALAGECTACTRLRNGRRKYFSHRGDRGYTGRMLSVIGVTP